MSTYRIGVGHNLILGSLFELDPQPKSTGLQATRRTFTGNSVVDEGLYTEWVWDVVDGDVLYRDILSASALLHIYTWSECTIYARNEIFNWRRYNATAIRPQPVWDNYFPRLTILFRDLVEIGL